MNLIPNIFGTSLGKKYVMAITGLVMFLFVIGHLAGNLQIFLGPESINRYGHFLQTNPELIWPARIILLLMLVLHIWAAIKVSAENKAARPVGYVAYQPVGSSYASRTMLMSGLIIFYILGMALLCLHLSHGVSSMFQSIGWKNKAYGPLLDQLARVVAILIFIGYSSIPISILLGYGKERLP
jgi:succinate dehydrogenase / fumarate reductase cytochrome b subunit